MNDKQRFIQQGFSVLDTENKENKLIDFIKEHYPQVLKDGELNLAELKSVLGLPIDEKVNGYGLNFVGRGVARAKYAQETQKELLLNRTLSKDIDTTQNMVLKGDNLDSLKLLKPHYSGKIKCIYIDPPYNTSSDEFVYPDKFDREEAEVLGIADNLSEEDFDRMEFSFKTKKSHNGWLAFMYPRLLLARDLLAKDGVIFISIDDNEQANLKLLCDEIFGEENFVADFIRKTKSTTNDAKTGVNYQHEFLLCYAKNIEKIDRLKGGLKDTTKYTNPDNDPNGRWAVTDPSAKSGNFQNGYFPVINPYTGKEDYPPKGMFWRFSKNTIQKHIDEGRICFKKEHKPDERGFIYKRYLKDLKTLDSTLDSLNFTDNKYMNQVATKELKEMELVEYFSYPKGVKFVYDIISSCTQDNDIILDFFAGSGTTGHAVMALNAEDGGNRKFILCQIDEPIAEGKPAYQFCIDNDLPPVISSITIERLRRVSSLNPSEGGTSNKGKAPSLSERVGGEELGEDYGFKVFDHTNAPKLTQDKNGQIVLPTLHNDALSRIYTMIFKVGLDEPSQVPQEVLKDCIYKIGHYYYITNSQRFSEDYFANVIKDISKNNGKIFVDGWTTSLNATLQYYKEEIQIVF
ncbi:site-specific DNA-methyltransferase [Capnocytophaga canis]|uniref:site-specific DNA-methyltransferase (adenine-specific) n=1 Tax=Capnocytophaga canis TaxID=1848903 RepID=A0A0B7ICB1_9FLAO|nr:site-specific DNA-methyltransferase [Capnocytophaga canis]CEN47568.1 DNA methylase family protein [Capnocytophaga canis]